MILGKFGKVVDQSPKKMVSYTKIFYTVNTVHKVIIAGITGFECKVILLSKYLLPPQRLA